MSCAVMMDGWETRRHLATKGAIVSLDCEICMETSSFMVNLPN